MTHTLLLAVGFGLALATGAGGVLTLRLIPPGAGRAPALAALGLPPAILGFTSAHLVPALWAECAALTRPELAVVAGWSAVVAGSAAAGLISGLRRLLLAEYVLVRVPVLGGHPLVEKVKVVAGRLGVRTPVVRVLEVDRPLVVSGGIRRPAVVVSRWVLENLDEPELEAVVAHELGHLARGSYWALWVGRLLRDAAWYLPSGRYAFGVLVRDEELGADELAVSVTGRPLTLAWALGKVWAGSSGSLAAGLVGLLGEERDAGRLLEARITRLLAGVAGCRRSPAPVLAVVIQGLLAMGSWQLLGLAAEALPMVCRFGSF